MEKLLKTQNKFQRMFGFDFDKLADPERVEYIKEMALHMNIETSEMLMELPYLKHWKSYNPFTYPEKIVKAKEEFIDVLTFMLNIALALGFTAEEITMMYMKKNAVNIKRQVDGYGDLNV